MNEICSICSLEYSDNVIILCKLKLYKVNFPRVVPIIKKFSLKFNDVIGSPNLFSINNNNLYLSLFF